MGRASSPTRNNRRPRPRPTASLPVLEKDDLDGEVEPGKNGTQTSDKEEASALLEEALTTYQEAQTALDRGETDPALSKLDEAYGLILKANTPQDSDLCQEKNDLRILIAQRIQQLYASHLKTAAVGQRDHPPRRKQVGSGRDPVVSDEGEAILRRSLQALRSLPSDDH